jgi:hypothetical protein
MPKVVLLARGLSQSKPKIAAESTLVLKGLNFLSVPSDQDKRIGAASQTGLS